MRKIVLLLVWTHLDWFLNVLLKIKIGVDRIDTHSTCAVMIWSFSCFILKSLSCFLCFPALPSLWLSVLFLIVSSHALILSTCVSTCVSFPRVFSLCLPACSLSDRFLFLFGFCPCSCSIQLNKPCFWELFLLLLGPNFATTWQNDLIRENGPSTGEFFKYSVVPTRRSLYRGSTRQFPLQPRSLCRLQRPGFGTKFMNDSVGPTHRSFYPGSTRHFLLPPRSPRLVPAPGAPSLAPAPGVPSQTPVPGVPLQTIVPPVPSPSWSVPGPRALLLSCPALVPRVPLPTIVPPVQSPVHFLLVSCQIVFVPVRFLSMFLLDPIE